MFFLNNYNICTVTVRILIKFYIYPKGQPEERKDLLTNLYFTWKKCKRILVGFFL